MVADFVTENLVTGRIRPSKSEWGMSVFCIKKKDGKYRIVQDYRKLNAVTVKNVTPLPRIQDLLEALKEYEWFTSLDIRWGYNNV